MYLKKGEIDYEKKSICGCTCGSSFQYDSP